MEHRAHRSSREREVRSRLVQLLSSQPLICGSVTVMERTCGKEHCRCVEGHKHVSLYLSVRSGGKRKMLYVPAELEERVRQWVGNYQEVGRRLEELSQSSLKQFEQDKHGVQEQRAGRRGGSR